MELEVLYGNPRKAKKRKAKKAKKTVKRKVKHHAKKKVAKKKPAKRKVKRAKTHAKKKPAKRKAHAKKKPAKRKVKRAKTSHAKKRRKTRKHSGAAMARAFASTPKRGSKLYKAASKKQKRTLAKYTGKAHALTKRVTALLHKIAKRHKLKNPMATTYKTPLGKTRVFRVMSGLERQPLEQFVQGYEDGIIEHTKVTAQKYKTTKALLALDEKMEDQRAKYAGEMPPGTQVSTKRVGFARPKKAVKKVAKKKKAKKSTKKKTHKTAKKGAKKMAKKHRKGHKKSHKKHSKKLHNWSIGELGRGKSVGFKSGKKRFKLKRTNPTVEMNPIPFVGGIQRSFGAMDKKQLAMKAALLLAAGAVYGVLNVGLAKALKPIPGLNKIPEMLAKVPALKGLLPAIIGGAVYLATKEGSRKGGAMGYLHQFGGALVMTGLVSAAANTVGPMLSAKLGMAGIPEGYGDVDFGTIPDGLGEADFGAQMSLLPEHMGEADFGDGEEFGEYDEASYGGVDFTPTSGVDFTPTSGVDFTPTSGDYDDLGMGTGLS